LLAAAGIGLLAATAAVAPGYAQQQVTPILVNGRQVTINGKYEPHPSRSRLPVLEQGCVFQS
jgi:hypothetical protein